MTRLFDPITVGGQVLSNRIVVSPMCQFAAEDGFPSAWHAQHLGSLSLSGAGLLILESTAVAKDGRISPACLGLYDHAHTAAYASLLKSIRSYSNIAIGIQLAHAGRKGSMKIPFEGEMPLAEEDGGWATCAPSAIAWGNRPSPTAATRGHLQSIIADYCNAAHRAVEAGFQIIELHAAHGYLIHQFLSPLTNHRTDEYGGRAENRMRFPIEIFAAIRDVVPLHCALGVRLSGSDWHPHGNNPEDAGDFAEALEALGADYFVVSSGGIVPKAQIEVAKGYQVPMAYAVKKRLKTPVMAVGMISEPIDADELVRKEIVDMVALGRAFLSDPRWGWHAAEALAVDLDYPLRYQAADPRNWQPGATRRPRSEASA